MWHLPRIALGTLQPEARREPALWGLLSVLQRSGLTPQAFQSRCSFTCHDGAMAVTGRATRHLDSWVMNRSACVRTLRRGIRGADFALVEGTLPDDDQSVVDGDTLPLEALSGGTLSQLCDWLDLPRIGVVDVHGLTPCSLPRRPSRMDAVFLDRVRSAEDAHRWRVDLESLWGVPVLGWLGETPGVRRAIERLAPGAKPSSDICQQLGDSLASNVQLDKLLNLANRSALPNLSPQAAFENGTRRRLQVAVAYDEDFTCHFPDTLDQLEAIGAVVRDFSPLRSDSIPSRTDLVILGCGHIEPHLEALAANHCLQQSLRSFAASGGRIYAEGSGLAYLCRQVILPDGRTAPMTGLLPATARRSEGNIHLEPAEVTFGASCWMADAKTKLRGYRANAWQIEPAGSMMSYACDPRRRCDLLGRANIIGSQVLVNFAAQPHLLRRFFYPYVPVSVALKL